jgi:hypothetical protein
MVEHDEADTDWPAEVDPINAAICPLFEVVFAHTRDGSPERRAAMSEVLHIAERIRAALAPKPTLN